MMGLGSRIVGAAKSGTIAPWVGLVAAVCIQVLARNTYNFPLYSSKLKETLGYNQVQLSNLGVANDIRENMGLLASLVYNKISPSGSLLIGAAASFVGYGILWLVVSETISYFPYWVVILSFFLWVVIVIHGI